MRSPHALDLAARLCFAGVLALAALSFGVQCSHAYS